ncbi:MAG: dephospho-CoA kinase [Nitrospirae bacterium]|nr:dephospho-CoA kinase [Nitrospirota bacterium]
MILVGLTGGIASGKSTASRIFKKLGAYVIDADVLAREVVEPFKPAWRDIVKNFGREILNKDKSINRSRLAEIVFNNKKKRELLNSIVHPRVFRRAKEIEREIVKRDQEAVIIFDAALLIESGAYKRMDKNIVVYADEDVQIYRLVKRDRLAKEDAIKRIRAQIPLKKKLRFADYIIDGNKTFSIVARQVKNVLMDLKGIK